jgi:uncharacterized phage protein (TIGR02218 family)
MRAIPAAMAAKIATGATTFCRCWLMTRKDGVALGFTDHDRDLVIAGTTFEAASGLDRTAVEAAEGLAVGGGEIAGALVSARILPEEIGLGLYDGAELKSWLVDWSTPALDLLLEVATLGEIRLADGRFVAEMRNPLHHLEAETGRRYAPDCSAELGDPACGVNLATSTYRVVTTIGSIPDGSTVVAAAIANFAAGFFTRGRVSFTSGVNAGLVVPVREHLAGGRITLWQALTRLPAPGDGITVTAGCDKSFTTCRAKFANALNFRGFPYIPQPELVIAYAQPGEGRHQGRPLVV